MNRPCEVTVECPNCGADNDDREGYMDMDTGAVELDGDPGRCERCDADLTDGSDPDPDWEEYE